jgi:hypothetical protein
MAALKNQIWRTGRRGALFCKWMVVIGTQRYRQVGGGTLRRFPYFSRNQRKSPKIGLLEKKKWKKWRE